MQRLLVAVDFSPISETVIEHAAALARALGAELTLLHVASPDPAFVGFQAGPATVRDDRARTLRGEHRRLQESAAALREQGLAAKALLVQGPTVATILEEAERLGASTILAGSHGHGALHRALLGSVSEGIVRGAACPIYLVPAGRPS